MKPLFGEPLLRKALFFPFKSSISTTTKKLRVLTVAKKKAIWHLWPKFCAPTRRNSNSSPPKRPSTNQICGRRDTANCQMPGFARRGGEGRGCCSNLWSAQYLRYWYNDSSITRGLSLYTVVLSRLSRDLVFEIIKYVLSFEDLWVARWN